MTARRHMAWGLAAAIGVAALSVAAAPARRLPTSNGWPAFQNGPARTGAAEAGLSKRAPHIAWTYRPEGKGNGFLDWGAVVWRGTVFTPDGLNHIVALDGRTGAVRWTQQLISNTFTVTYAAGADLLVVTTAITTKPTPTLFALRPDTGAIVWDNTINGQPAVGGMEGAPAVVGDRVYINYLQYEGAGGICAYVVGTGALLWRHPLPHESSYSPVAADMQRVYVGSETGRIYALNATTGEIEWAFQAPAKPQLSAPTLVDDRVLLAAGDSLIALRADTGAVIWQQPLGGTASASSPAVHGGRLYVGTRDGALTAFDAATGQRLWSTPLDAGAIESSPAIDLSSRQVVVGSSSNIVCVVDAATGTVRSRTRLTEHNSGNWKNSPAIADGFIYIGSVDKTFYALTASR